jgi:hypothetical protein
MSSDLLRQIEQETLRAGERRRAANSLGFCALQEVERRHEQHEARDFDRTPCWQCGTRGDRGCDHRQPVRIEADYSFDRSPPRRSPRKNPA